MIIAIKLRYLATGNTYRDTAFGFHVAPNTIYGVVKKGCKVIVTEYETEVIQIPNTPCDFTTN